MSEKPPNKNPYEPPYLRFAAERAEEEIEKYGGFGQLSSDSDTDDADNSVSPYNDPELREIAGDDSNLLNRHVAVEILKKRLAQDPDNDQLKHTLTIMIDELEAYQSRGKDLPSE